MATIGIFENISLDGVMQAPGDPEEDTRGGFRHGGWAVGFSDEVALDAAREHMAGTTALLFGRRTYQDLLGFWTSTPEENPFTGALVQTPKYVVSREPDTKLDHPASTLLVGEAVETVRALRDEVDGSMTVLGSGALVRDLHAAGLVDRYFLQVHPVVLGSGTRIFDGGARVDLTLVRALPTTTGVLLAEYARR